MRTAHVLALLVLLSIPAGAVLPLGDVLARMEQAERSIQDVSFTFVEHVRQGNVQGKITGEVQLKKPHLLRVVQATPQKQVIMTDGTTLSLYTPEQKQLLKGDWKAWVERTHFPLALLDFIGAFSADPWSKRYIASLGGYENKLYEIRFKPFQPGDMPLTLWVSEDSFLPVRGDLKGNGIRAQITLKGIQTNTGLDASLFEPHVSSDTIVVPITF